MSNPRMRTRSRSPRSRSTRSLSGSWAGDMGRHDSYMDAKAGTWGSLGGVSTRSSRSGKNSTMPRLKRSASVNRLYRQVIEAEVATDPGQWDIVASPVRLLSFRHLGILESIPGGDFNQLSPEERKNIITFVDNFNGFRIAMENGRVADPEPPVMPMSAAPGTADTPTKQPLAVNGGPVQALEDRLMDGQVEDPSHFMTTSKDAQFNSVIENQFAAPAQVPEAEAAPEVQEPVPQLPQDPAPPKPPHHPVTEPEPIQEEYIQSKLSEREYAPPPPTRSRVSSTSSGELSHSHQEALVEEAIASGPEVQEEPIFSINRKDIKSTFAAPVEASVAQEPDSDVPEPVRTFETSETSQVVESKEIIEKDDHTEVKVTESKVTTLQEVEEITREYPVEEVDPSLLQLNEDGEILFTKEIHVVEEFTRVETQKEVKSGDIIKTDSTVQEQFNREETETGDNGPVLPPCKLETEAPNKPAPEADQDKTVPQEEATAEQPESEPPQSPTSDTTEETDEENTPSKSKKDRFLDFFKRKSHKDKDEDKEEDKDADTSKEEDPGAKSDDELKSDEKQTPEKKKRHFLVFKKSAPKDKNSKEGETEDNTNNKEEEEEGSKEPELAEAENDDKEKPENKNTLEKRKKHHFFNFRKSKDQEEPKEGEQEDHKEEEASQPEDRRKEEAEKSPKAETDSDKEDKKPEDKSSSETTTIYSFINIKKSKDQEEPKEGEQEDHKEEEASQPEDRRKEEAEKSPKAETDSDKEDKKPEDKSSSETTTIYSFINIKKSESKNQQEPKEDKSEHKEEDHGKEEQQKSPETEAEIDEKSEDKTVEKKKKFPFFHIGKSDHKNHEDHKDEETKPQEEDNKAEEQSSPEAEAETDEKSEDKTVEKKKKFPFFHIGKSDHKNHEDHKDEETKPQEEDNKAEEQSSPEAEAETDEKSEDKTLEKKRKFPFFHIGKSDHKNHEDHKDEETKPQEEDNKAEEQSSPEAEADDEDRSEDKNTLDKKKKFLFFHFGKKSRDQEDSPTEDKEEDKEQEAEPKEEDKDQEVEKEKEAEVDNKSEKDDKEKPDKKKKHHFFTFRKSKEHEDPKNNDAEEKEENEAKEVEEKQPEDTKSNKSESNKNTLERKKRGFFHFGKSEPKEPEQEAERGEEEEANEKEAGTESKQAETKHTPDKKRRGLFKGFSIGKDKKDKKERVTVEAKEIDSPDTEEVPIIQAQTAPETESAPKPHLAVTDVQESLTVTVNEASPEVLLYPIDTQVLVTGQDKELQVLPETELSTEDDMEEQTERYEIYTTKERPKSFMINEDKPNGPSPSPQPSTSHLAASLHSPNDSFDSAIAISSRRSVGSDAHKPPDGPGHFVIVAIDFGTTFSGYAFSFTRDPDAIHMMRKWEGGDPGVINQKTPTCLLLHPDGKFHSFGFTARDFFHDLDPQESKKWLFFDKFKMTLHYNAELNKDTMIKSINGKLVSALTIFSYALRFFKEHALQELSDQSSTKILNEDVRWVITVPAIWKAAAKQFMRQAAYSAGIAAQEYPDKLLIALEPEAASIYVRKLRMHQLVPEKYAYRTLSPKKEGTPEPMNMDKVSDEMRNGPRKSWSYPHPPSPPSSPGSVTSSAAPGTPTTEYPTSPITSPEIYPLTPTSEPVVMPLTGIESVGSQINIPGTRYIVVDCGGGTVDITVHEMESKYGNLLELYKATGGPYGSVGVDIEFEKLLVDVFGSDFIEAFKVKRPAGWVDLMIAFESRKRAATPYKNNPLNVSLPFSFIDYHKKYRNAQVESVIRKHGDKEIRWSSQGMLRLLPEAMRRLFQPTLDRIRQSCGDVLNNPGVKDIRYMFLVGGFSESQILQHQMRQEFGHLLRIIIPQDVSLTILKGAVCFGMDPTIVKLRKSRMTYGVGVLNRFVHGKHPKSKMVKKDGIEWCTDIYDKFVFTDQSVALGDTTLRSYTPAKAGQKSSIINIFCSDKSDPQFITDKGVKKIGTLCLDLSETQYEELPKRREIQTRMIFGDTEIKVSALDVATGKCVRSAIDFLNK